MDKPELIYFDLQGRATLTRIMLRMSGCEWKDTRIPANKTAWAEQKPKFENDALGSVPVLKINGQFFCQSEAIADWAADKAGLRSEDPVRRMQVHFTINCFKLTLLLQEKMIAETFKEVLEKALMGSMAEATKQLGNVRELGSFYLVNKQIQIVFRS